MLILHEPLRSRQVLSEPPPTFPYKCHQAIFCPFISPEGAQKIAWCRSPKVSPFSAFAPLRSALHQGRGYPWGFARFYFCAGLSPLGYQVDCLTFFHLLRYASRFYKVGTKQPAPLFCACSVTLRIGSRWGRCLPLW